MLRIANWDLYENNRTKEIARLAWLPIPNDLAADGYVSLVNHQDGAAHLGAWHAILMLASKTPRPYRGWLRRENGQPHDANSISLATRLQIPLVEAVLERLVELGLVEGVNGKQRKSKELPSHSAATSPQTHAGTSHHVAAEQNRTEQNHHHRTEEKRKEGTEGTERTGTEGLPGKNATAGPTPVQNFESLNGDDDDTSPEQKLAGLFEQNNEVLTDHMLRTVKEDLELRNIKLATFVEALTPKLQPNGAIRSVEAVTLSFLKKFRTKTRPARMPIREVKRCSRCRDANGRGAIIAEDGVTFIACPECSTPEWVSEFALKEAERAAKQKAGAA